MIASISAALVSLDTAAQAPTSAEKDDAGAEFGKAVKHAAREHGRKPAGAKAEARDAVRAEVCCAVRAEVCGAVRAEVCGAVRAEVCGAVKADARGAVKAKASADAKDDAMPEAEAAADDAAPMPDEGTSATDDLLGRLLGAVFQPASAPLPAAGASRAASTKATEDGAEGEDVLGERIVISTVADLNGAPAKGEGKDTRIALRVTRMETHFEPRLEAPTLVEAGAAETEATSATSSPASKQSADGPKETGVKPVFEEVLQRLGRGGETGSGTAGGEGQAQSDAGGRQKSAASVRDARAEVSADMKVAAAATIDRESAADAAKPATTGQIISSQVAERIIEAFSSGEGSAPPGASGSSSSSGQFLRMTAGGAALKTLSIQLEPQDLGRVDVSMRLVDGRLTVELAASEPSTALALAGDRHGLRKILEHAGFALDDAAITVVARDLGQATLSSSTPSSSGERQEQGAGSNAGGGNGGERQAGEGASQNDRRRRQEAGEGSSASRAVLPQAQRPAGSLYL